MYFKDQFSLCTVSRNGSCQVYVLAETYTRVDGKPLRMSFGPSMSTHPLYMQRT